MPDGGRLTIETANAYLDEDYASQFGDVSAGPIRAAERVGYRHRHLARGAATGVRAVLHDQGRGQGLGPRPRHGARLRQAVGRAHPHLQRGRPRHGGEDLSAAPDAERGSLGGTGRGATAAAGETRARPQETITARRGQRRRARLHQIDARGARLSRAGGGRRRAGLAPARRRPQDRSALHRRGAARRHQRARAGGPRSCGSGQACRCYSRPATPATPSSTTGASTRTSTCSASPIRSRTSRARSASCWTSQSRPKALQDSAPVAPPASRISASTYRPAPPVCCSADRRSRWVSRTG